jgi:hypothetical protein
MDQGDIEGLKADYLMGTADAIVAMTKETKAQ